MVSRKVPDWPFKCPKEGWYLSKVEAIWEDDVTRVPGEFTVPILIYGTCKQHGTVWLSDTKAYEASIWREHHESDSASDHVPGSVTS